MAKTADLHIRIDPETKTNAEQLFATFGISVSDAVIMFLRQSLYIGGLPFELRQPRYNDETEAAIQESKDIIAGKIQAKAYSTLHEFYADLDKEGDDVGI